MKTKLLIFCAFILFNAQFSMLNGQSQMDSVRVKKHSPKTATWLALFPGAGQVYNKKYWKVPIVYGGLVATGYLVYYYQSETSLYRNEYVARLNRDSLNFNPNLADIPDQKISNDRDKFRRNMEICIAACAIVYALNIIDACVDAHLFYYDVSDNLSMAIRPKINYYPVNGSATLGLALFIKF